MLAAISIMTGVSLFAFLTNMLYLNLDNLSDKLRFYVLIYLSVSGLFSAAYIYCQGPITNPRKIKVIEFSLKIVSVVFVYMKHSNRLELLIFYCFVFYLVNYLSFYMVHKIFIKKRTLLTMQEFDAMGEEFTRLEIDKLRKYCLSSECNAWDIINKLRNPQR